MSEVKTIKYRFYRSEVPRCEKIEHGLPCDDFRHKSGRGKRTRRVSQRLLVGKASVNRPIEMKKADLSVCYFYWSGLRGSNPPPPPWQGGALPNELNPRKWCLRSESNQRHRDFQSLALPTELQRHIGWRLGWGSNPRPLA